MQNFFAENNKKEKIKYDNAGKSIFTRTEEWNEVEEAVMTYKKQFEENCLPEDRIKAEASADKILHYFRPLFMKYLNLLKTGHIGFKDSESKRFVLSFIGDASLRRELKKPETSEGAKKAIMQKFNFVKEVYGGQDDEDILTDLKMFLLVLARRYRQMGFNFCAYVYNSYCYEVSRHIKAYIKVPGNVPYNSVEYEDYMRTSPDGAVEMNLEDKTCEGSNGLPDLSWIAGSTCGDAFSTLNPLERKILVKYYLEDYNDRQIADEIGMHINTCNQRRRQAVAKVAEAAGLNPKDVKRNRKIGKKNEV